MATASRGPFSVAPAPRGDNLADVLERVLDKGLVIAGDIRINLLDIELLTIKVRLLLASADKAQALGMRWWENDPFFSGDERTLADANRDLMARLERLEQRLDALPPGDREQDQGQRAEPSGEGRDNA